MSEQERNDGQAEEQLQDLDVEEEQQDDVMGGKKRGRGIDQRQEN